MSRLVARLSKLEQRQGASKEGSSFIIQRQLFWREGDVLCSAPAYASVLKGTGWARIVHSVGETEADFEARVDAKADCHGAGRKLARSRTRRSHPTHHTTPCFGLAIS
jgi:hypothetical protein